MTSRAIQALVGGGPPDADAIGKFLEHREFPILEDGGVTFVFRGDAEQVRLRHLIYGLPTSQPFRRVEGTDLWYLVMELPRCSRVEYKFERVVDGRHEWIMDPLNDRIAHDPFGANSVCYGEGYETPEWTLPDSSARPGTLETFSIESRALGGVRHSRIYLPARFRRRRRYPLLLVHDGGDYLRFAELKVVLDNLIHRLEIPPMIVALMRPENRLVEYAADERHSRYLTEELLPALESHYPLLAQPKHRALMGASFGGVAALSTAWRHPGVYGRLLLQSGSFVFSDIGKHDRGEVFDPVARFVNEFRDNPGRPTDKIFISCGTYESLIYENRSIVPLLQATKMSVRYVEARDGHNWDNWRDRLREGLSWLFPGPLWMVYE